MEQQAAKQVDPLFAKKVWIAGGIVAFIVVLLLFFEAVFSVLLLVLAGVLIALFFRGLSARVQRKTGWKEGLCVAIAIASTLLIIALIFWLIGAKVQVQLAQLSETLPATIENARNKLDETPLGQKVAKEIGAQGTQKRAVSFAQRFFTSSFGVLGDIYIVLFIGIFLTVSPRQYADGMIKLVPPSGKGEAKVLLGSLADMLTRWLKGQLFAMLIVFAMTAIGLAIIGVPLWLSLALIAGILSFIPNFGPLIALVIAFLVGLMQGTTTAFWILGLYLFVQVAESNFITPMLQQKLINVPPALLIISQLLIASLTGGWGLVLATPLLVITMVVVQQLYINKQKPAA